MLGFNLVPVKLTVLLLINGTNATFTILSPSDVLTTLGTIDDLIPVLVWLTCAVLVVTTSLAVTLQPPAPLPLAATLFDPV